MRWILLPGLDGTGRLFASFLAACPRSWSTRVVAYPTDQPWTYPQLLEFLESQLEDEREVVLLGESFSGPLAVQWAARHPDRMRGLVLAASFVRNPLPRSLRPLVRLVHPGLFSWNLPNWAARTLLLGRDAPPALLQEFRSALQVVAPSVVATRIRELGTLDAASELRSLTCPLAYLQARSDRLVGTRGLEQVRAVHPEVDVLTEPGPHLLLQRRPRELVNSLGKWARSHGLV